MYFLARGNFDVLIRALADAGYEVLGPTLDDAELRFRPIASSAELPCGMICEQAPGRVAWRRAGHRRFFAWAQASQGLKPLLFPAREVLWQATRGEALTFASVVPEAPRRAVLGVRACDLAAAKLNDRVFLAAVTDPRYRARRQALLLVAVHCSHPAATCFCASTGDGPVAAGDCDLALGELDEGFVIAAHSERGEAILASLALPLATSAQKAELARQHEAARDCQQRHLPSPPHLLRLWQRLDHPRWQEVADRCLACGNCTQVCPTCFCHAEEEEGGTDLAESRHVRLWDSCFTAGHAYIHGWQIRPGVKERYRQWLTHKLAGWQQQFGRPGCVGCGRCIAWCPAAIDFTEEVHALLDADAD